MVTTLNDAWLDVKKKLFECGIESSSLEAKELVCFGANIPREQFYEKRANYLFDKELSEIDRLTKLRISGYPIQYIIGQWDFHGLTFDVSSDVLIPRTETEALVDSAIEFLGERERGRILELGCGSGCIVASLLHDISSGFTAVATDIDPKALALTRKNLMKHKLISRVITQNYDMREPIPETFGKFNLIVSNPPYVSSDDISRLQKEVQYEPRLALDGGEDGLDFYRAIAANCKNALLKNGCIILEIGEDQADDVTDIFLRAGYQNVFVKKDMFGNDRIVRASL